MQGENRQKSGAYLFVCEHFLVIFNAAVGVSDDAITEFLCRVEVTHPQVLWLSLSKSTRVALTQGSNERLFLAEVVGLNGIIRF